MFQTRWGTVRKPAPASSDQSPDRISLFQLTNRLCAMKPGFLRLTGPLDTLVPSFDPFRLTPYTQLDVSEPENPKS